MTSNDPRPAYGWPQQTARAAYTISHSPMQQAADDDEHDLRGGIVLDRDEVEAIRQRVVADVAREQAWAASPIGRVQAGAGQVLRPLVVTPAVAVLLLVASEPRLFLAVAFVLALLVGVGVVRRRFT